MIAIEQHTGRLDSSVFGEFTLADFKEFEKAAQDKLDAGEKPLDLVFDFTEMLDFTLDVAWEDIKFSRQHAADFGKIAVVTDDQWVAWSAWLSNAFVHAAMRVFPDYESANAWVSSE